MKYLTALTILLSFLGCQSSAKKEMKARKFSSDIKSKGELVRVIADKDNYGVSQFIGEKRLVVSLMQEQKKVNEDAYRTDEVEKVTRAKKKDVVRVDNIEDQWGEVQMQSTSGAVYVLMKPMKDSRRFRWYEKDEVEGTIANKYNGYGVGKEVFLVKEKTRAKIEKLTKTHVYVAFRRQDGLNLKKWVPMDEVVK